LIRPVCSKARRVPVERRKTGDLIPDSALASRPKGLLGLIKYAPGFALFLRPSGDCLIGIKLKRFATGHVQSEGQLREVIESHRTILQFGDFPVSVLPAEGQCEVASGTTLDKRKVAA